MSKGNKVSGYTHTKQQLDDYANRNNPNSMAHKSSNDNHSNQLNPNNKEYWHSRNDSNK